LARIPKTDPTLLERVGNENNPGVPSWGSNRGPLSPQSGILMFACPALPAIGEYNRYSGPF